LGIPFELAVHARPALTVAEAAAQRNMRAGQLVKTMVLRLPDGSHAAALVPGDREVDLRLVRAALGVRRPAWVERGNVEALTGYPPGAVSPVGIEGVSVVLSDPLLAEAGEVAISSGVSAAPACGFGPPTCCARSMPASSRSAAPRTTLAVDRVAGCPIAGKRPGPAGTGERSTRAPNETPGVVRSRDLKSRAE